MAGPEIERVVQLLARLPGLGPRSARRAALHLIRKREELLGPLSEAMTLAYQHIVTCSVCGNVDTTDPCAICQDPRRDRATLVIVETVADLWALERAKLISARYHVLGGVLSPLDGVGPEELGVGRLIDRLREAGAREIILALNATVDGQTTAHYLADLLHPLGVKTTRLAHGVPVGGELDYLDEGTLAAALERRTEI